MKKLEFSLILSFAFLLLACNTPDSFQTTLTAPARAISDNDIYVSDRFGTIHALRPDGTEQWAVKLSAEIARIANAPVSRDLIVEFLAADPNGKVFGLAMEESGGSRGQRIMFALDANRLLWQQEVPYPSKGKGSVTISRDSVVLAGNDGVLYSYDKSSGNLIWQYKVSNEHLGEPASGADGTIYVTGVQHELHAVGTDGTPQWVRSFSEENSR